MSGGLILGRGKKAIYKLAFSMVCGGILLKRGIQATSEKFKP